jgi:hypothetical protein
MEKISHQMDASYLFATSILLVIAMICMENDCMGTFVWRKYPIKCMHHIHLRVPSYLLSQS